MKDEFYEKANENCLTRANCNFFVAHKSRKR